MTKIFRFCILMGFIIVSVLFINYQNAYWHETTHKQIAIYNGCTDYEIEYNWKGGYFRCNSYDNGKLDQRLEYQQDSINEIVGYNMTSLINTLVILTTILILAMYFFSDR